MIFATIWRGWARSSSAILFLSAMLSGVCFAQNTDKDLKELKGEHFIIYYHKDVSLDSVYKIRNMCEDYYRKVTQEFNLIRSRLWLWDNRAKVYIAKDKDDFAARFPCPDWAGACVEYNTKVIYTFPDQQGFASGFVHELAHIMFREYIGDRNLPLWLDEAIAAYVENKYSNGNYKGQLAMLKDKIEQGAYIKFSELNTVTPGQLEKSSQDYINLFYIEAFSVVNYLIERYQRDNFSQFLFALKNSGNVEDALDKSYTPFKSMGDLEREWRKYYSQ